MNNNLHTPEFQNPTQQNYPYPNQRRQAATSSKYITIGDVNIRKSLIVIVACILIFALILEYTPPIVLAIRMDPSVNENLPVEHNYTFYREGNYMYCLKDGSNPFEVTVVYLNRSNENIIEAMASGRITVEDLDRFNVNYAIIPR